MDGFEIAIIPAVLSKLWALESPTFGKYGRGVPELVTPASLTAVSLWGWAWRLAEVCGRGWPHSLTVVFGVGNSRTPHGSRHCLGKRGPTTRIRRICSIWKHCLRRAFSLARRKRICFESSVYLSASAEMHFAGAEKSIILFPEGRSKNWMESRSQLFLPS